MKNQIIKFLCKIGIHSWKQSHHIGVNIYYECGKCNKRDVMLGRGCYQPIDEQWLNHQKPKRWNPPRGRS